MACVLWLSKGIGKLKALIIGAAGFVLSVLVASAIGVLLVWLLPIRGTELTVIFMPIVAICDIAGFVLTFYFVDKVQGS